MAYKTLITILLTLVLLGGVAWWYVKYQPSTTPVTQTPVTGISNTPNTTNVTVGTSSTQTKPVDLAAEYDSIFTKLGAAKVSFTIVTSASDPTFGSLYSLYASDIAAAKKLPNPSTPTFEMATGDLNGDGTPEAIVYENIPGYSCGSAGCELDVYTKKGTKWQNVLSVQTYDKVAVAAAKTNGYADLYLSVVTGSGNAELVQYVWSGSAYVQGNAVATWDGSSFEPVK